MLVCAISSIESPYPLPACSTTALTPVPDSTTALSSTRQHILLEGREWLPLHLAA